MSFTEENEEETLLLLIEQSRENPKDLVQCEAMEVLEQ